MAVIAIRKNAWDVASNAQRAILKLAVAKLQLGQPATYMGGGQEWYVFSDSRITHRQVAVLGTLMKGLAGLPSSWTPPTIIDAYGADTGRVDRAATEALIFDFVKDNIVAPKDITYTAGDMWQETLDAQAAPGAIRAAGSVPASWSPVGGA